MNGDGTETGVEVCLACEPNGSDGCRRENLLHARRVRGASGVFAPHAASGRHFRMLPHSPVATLVFKRPGWDTDRKDAFYFLF